jgi:hypothetical protein
MDCSKSHTLSPPLFSQQHLDQLRLTDVASLSLPRILPSNAVIGAQWGVDPPSDELSPLDPVPSIDDTEFKMILAQMKTKADAGFSSVTIWINDGDEGKLLKCNFDRVIKFNIISHYISCD